MRTCLAVLWIVAGCQDRGTRAPSTPSAPVAAAPIDLTYLGVAGWQLDAAGSTVLLDPYFSRPDLGAGAPIVPDADAIARRAPARADLVLIGHSHVDHLLDAPAVAIATGALLVGSVSTTRVGRASGVAEAQLRTIQGGEELDHRGVSVQVRRSLHSVLDEAHLLGAEIPAAPTLPLRFAEYAEGGTFAYFVTLAGRRILLLSTANFVEAELDGLRPEIAIVATGLRERVPDYSCRLMRALGHPPRVYATHFDNWRAPPVDVPPSDDLRAFIAEIAACSPQTVVVIPRHFERMTVR